MIESIRHSDVLIYIYINIYKYKYNAEIYNRSKKQIKILANLQIPTLTYAHCALAVAVTAIFVIKLVVQEAKFSCSFQLMQ